MCYYERLLSHWIMLTKEKVRKKFISLSIHTIRYYGKIDIVKIGSFWGSDDKPLTEAGRIKEEFLFLL